MTNTLLLAAPRGADLTIEELRQQLLQFQEFHCSKVGRLEDERDAARWNMKLAQAERDRATIARNQAERRADKLEDALAATKARIAELEHALEAVRLAETVRD